MTVIKIKSRQHSVMKVVIVVTCVGSCINFTQDVSRVTVAFELVKVYHSAKSTKSKIKTPKLINLKSLCSGYGKSCSVAH